MTVRGNAREVALAPGSPHKIPTQISNPIFNCLYTTYRYVELFSLTFWWVLTYQLKDRHLFLYLINQIDVAGICSVIDHRRGQNLVRTSLRRSAIA